MQPDSRKVLPVGRYGEEMNQLEILNICTLPTNDDFLARHHNLIRFRPKQSCRSPSPFHGCKRKLQTLHTQAGWSVVITRFPICDAEHKH